jgi:hypothetical protein
MLGRSLFEDMVVAHWLVLHNEDPGWLIARFEGHRDAMRLYDVTVREQVNWMPSGDDISELAGQEENLRSEFGQYAEKDWWGRDRRGQRITMPKLVETLADHRQFQPRLKGEQPILEQAVLRDPAQSLDSGPPPHRCWNESPARRRRAGSARSVRPEPFRDPVRQLLGVRPACLRGARTGCSIGGRGAL